jgi:hypothetical protein
VKKIIKQNLSGRITSTDRIEQLKKCRDANRNGQQEDTKLRNKFLWGQFLFLWTNAKTSF